MNYYPRQRNKYLNQKTIIDGYKFDSKKEATRYSELKLLQKSWHIKNLRLQPKFLIQNRFIFEKKVEREMNYIADFYYEIDENKIVEDVKWKKTDVYKLKRKLFLKKYWETYQFVES